MRFADTVRLSLTALGQHKVRTGLTTLGVLVAVFLLICSMSVGRGVYEATMRQFRKGDSLREIRVYANYQLPEKDIPKTAVEVKGTMSDAKRARLRKKLIDEYRRLHRAAPVMVTQERLRKLSALPHVERVIPSLQRLSRATWAAHRRRTTYVAGGPDSPAFRQRLLAGDFFGSETEPTAIVSEYLLYRWGLVSDDDVSQALGQKIRLEYRMAGPPPLPGILGLLSGPRVHLSPSEKQLLERIVKHLPEARGTLHLDDEDLATVQRILGQIPVESRSARQTQAAEFTIVGVVREFIPDEDLEIAGLADVPANADVYLPMQTAEEFFFRSPRPDDNQVSSATVVVDDEANLRELIDQIKAMGLNEWSLVKFVDRVRLNLTLILFTIWFLAAVALLVSALGITNTMFMSVLERTREIGIMKAVGARSLHVQGIFLIEGALIGAVGGALGLALSWGVSFPGNSVARTLMERQTGTHLHESLFLFPLWLTLGVPLLAVLVTTLAALYPARRAAAVNPITALRYE